MVHPDVIARLKSSHAPSEVDQQLAFLAQHVDVIDDRELWLEMATTRGFKGMEIERVKECPCGTRDLVLLSRFLYWNLLGITTCRSCGLVMVSPRLTGSALNRIFNEHYFSRETPETWGLRREAVFEDILRIISRIDARTVFDVGSAHGHFVDWLLRRGVRAAGCDISATAIEWGREHLGTNILHGSLSALALAESSFDCITSLDTLYYLPDVREDLETMFRILKPGGHLILRLRNGRGIARRAAREGRRRVGREVLPAPHIWSFTPESIHVLLPKFGFSDVRCETAAYSHTIVSPFQNLVARALRNSRRFPNWIPTQSFNVVATKPKPH
jgi:SAM-dependent methyltransferase